MSEATAAEQGTAGTGGAPGLRCDFCGNMVPRVRRVALDAGYDRLQTPHQVRYACPECSTAKEQSRHRSDPA